MRIQYYYEEVEGENEKRDNAVEEEMGFRNVLGIVFGV